MLILGVGIATTLRMRKPVKLPAVVECCLALDSSLLEARKVSDSEDESDGYMTTKLHASGSTNGKSYSHTYHVKTNLGSGETQVYKARNKPKPGQSPLRRVGTVANDRDSREDFPEDSYHDQEKHDAFHHRLVAQRLADKLSDKK